MMHPRSSGGGHPGGLLGAVMGGWPPRTSPWLEVGGLILSALGDAQTGGDTDYLGSVLKMQNRMREREASAWELQERLRLAEFARQQEHAARRGAGFYPHNMPTSGQAGVWPQPGQPEQPGGTGPGPGAWWRYWDSPDGKLSPYISP